MAEQTASQTPDPAASKTADANERGDVAGQDSAAAGEGALSAAVEQTPEQVAASVKAAFEKEFPGINLDDVRPTRFAGIFELRIGSDLLYTNEKAEYVLQGTLIDARNKEDLTAKRLDELTRVAFDSLPLESAIKQVKGDGSRKIAVFEDPNCGYCKRLHQTLEGMDNYTVYTLLFPILSPDSTVKARNIWCAADRVQAWRDQMLKNQAPPNAQCETPIEANLAFGRGLLVRGTPAIIFEDGSRVNGALPREALEKRLDDATAAVAAGG
ncbi:DsbC family protein [Pusillimonas sp.]|uniref:DsbC family protein n=1 Tax=Pusillimonas sp. TaxID=3040095 RepID=UPI0037CB9C51